MILYHGTSSRLAPDAGAYLLPPEHTGVTPHHEATRADRSTVYLTPDKGYAGVYAGRAVSAVGGRPVVIQAWVPDSEASIFSDRAGARIVTAPAAYIINSEEH